MIEQPVGEVVGSADRAQRFDRQDELVGGVGGLLRGGEAGADQQRFGALHRRELAGRVPFADVEQLRLGGEIAQLVGTAGGQRPSPPSVVSGEGQGPLDLLDGDATPAQRLAMVVARRRRERSSGGHTWRCPGGPRSPAASFNFAEQLVGDLRIAA